jgi:hypothetical protein
VKANFGLDHQETIAVQASLSPSLPNAARSEKWRHRAGIALSALPVLFLLFDCTIKLLKIQPVVESFAELGYPDSLARGLGLLELACLSLYLIPRSAILGAIVLTGFLGGAIATHLRVGDPLFSHTLFPLYVAILVWGGVFLRDDTLRTLIPWRK